MPLNLKEFRVRVGLTQAAVAQHLGTSQQTYQRWEQGKSEPSIEQLQALARIFGTGLPNLLGLPIPANDTRSARDRYEDVAEFCGHVGIRIQNVTETLWYPVTEEARFLLTNQMSLDYEEERFLPLITLGGKDVYVRPSSLEYMIFVEDAEEFPEGRDAPSGRDLMDQCGFRSSTYRALDVLISRRLFDFVSVDGIDEAEIAEAARVLKDCGYDAEDEDDLTEAYAALNHTRVISVSGDVHSFLAEDRTLVDAESCLNEGDEPFLSLYNETGGYEISFPLVRIALVEIPTHRLDRAVDDLMAQDSEDLGLAEAMIAAVLDKYDGTSIPPPQGNA